MLAESQNYLREHHGAAKLYVFGQDYNKRAFATAASDMLMKAVDQNGGSEQYPVRRYVSEDQFTSPPYDKFDYLIANPPFGVDWKKQQREIERESEKLGFAGRFGAGLPRVNDGALLFLQHMISKFEPRRPAGQKYGSRLAIVFSGSPLFTGGAGSGESNIRKWIIENDWLGGGDCVAGGRCFTTPASAPIFGSSPTVRRNGARARPTNRRPRNLDAGRQRGSEAKPGRQAPPYDRGSDQGYCPDLWTFVNDGLSKIFDNEDFGYTRVTVERPLRLRYQMSTEAKARFLEACPHLLDDVEAIDLA